MIKKYFWWIILAIVVILVWRSMAQAKTKNDPFTPFGSSTSNSGQINYKEKNCDKNTSLGLGDVCDMVKKIQLAYNSKNPSNQISVDGYFGPETEIVVLKVTGSKRTSYMNFFAKLNNYFYVGN